MSILLTIAIPTYNRSARLRTALLSLLAHVRTSRCEERIAVLVSNNGSSDSTQDVIYECHQLFLNCGIRFDFTGFNVNHGFDENVLLCYNKCTTDYIWFLSDDDNINEHSILQILDDLRSCKPSLILYNFDQKPFNIGSPLIKEDVLYDKVSTENFLALKNLVISPKLSGLVLRVDNNIGECARLFKYNYVHVALAFLIGLEFGKIYHSKTFIAFPDLHYLDNIDFVPYVVNDLDKTVFSVLKVRSFLEIYPLLELTKVDPLVSSLNLLYLFYSGRWVLSSELKAKLWATVKREIGNNFFLDLFKYSLNEYKVIVFFLYSFVKYGLIKFLFKRDIGRLR